MSEHYDRVKEIIIDKLGVDGSKVTLEAKFIDDLGADSLDTVELIMQFEEDFNIEIPDEEAEGLRSVEQAVEYISKKINYPCNVKASCYNRHGNSLSNWEFSPRI